MGLREQAALDSQSILEDVSGFGWPFTLTSPLGVASARVGFTTDIGQTIDPDTGQAVAGRRASVAVSLRSLPEMPVAVPDRDRKPWIVSFASALGVFAAWKVIEVLPDRAAGVVVLLLEAYQYAIVVFNAATLVLPRLLLSGSFSPLVALSGDLVLPAPELAGSFTPWGELSGELGLPALQFAGEFSTAVELDGALALPSLQLEGSIAPSVELSATLALPSLQLAGAESADVSLVGTLPLPSLQLSGSVTPVVGSLSGALSLPALQLAGSITPVVGTLAGALTLPSAQLAGSLTPTVGTLAGALVLPSLQLTGALTVATSPVGSWLRLAASTINAGHYDTVANVLVPGNPTNQTVAGRRPTATTSANGLPCASYDGGDYWLLPIVASNNDPAVFGLHLWIKLTNTGARQRLVAAFFGSAGPRVLFDIVGGGILIQAASVYPNGMQYEKTNFLTVGVWTSLLFMVNANGATNADKFWVKKDGVLVTGGTFYFQGTGDMSVLATSSGSYQLGASSESDTPGSAMFAGTLTGPNWHFFNVLPSVEAQDAIRLLEVPT
jgi:hypothetical protein